MNLSGCFAFLAISVIKSPDVDEAKWSHLHHDVESGYYGEKKMPKRIFLGKKTLICPICGKEHQDTVKNICSNCRKELGVR